MAYKLTFWNETKDYFFNMETKAASKKEAIDQGEGFARVNNKNEEEKIHLHFVIRK